MTALPKGKYGAQAMILRPVCLSDAEALADLGRTSFVAKFGHLYDPADISAFLEQVYSPAAVRNDILDPLRRIQLACDGEELVGYCKMGLDGGWPEHARGNHPIELKQLYTAPDRTGHGIGARLMDWALDVARECGADEIQLSVFSDNPGAQAFYRRYGFEKVADIHFWVGNHRDDEFLYSLLLPG